MRVTTIKTLFKRLHPKCQAENQNPRHGLIMLLTTPSEDIYVKEVLEVTNKEERKKKSCLWTQTSCKNLNQKFDGVLRKLKLNISNIDPCINSHRGGTKLVIIASFVNDMLLFSNDRAVLDQFKSSLNIFFEIKYLGQIGQSLSMVITWDHDKGKIWISQKSSAKKGL
ncbi:uncharacterized protein LOC124737689 [Schistocerca piceifrons]|uniref:uncharacterized protein LOC124737689 n=1 Tax=Schistocerca piceifrons TaxID=274613 RepID=UPI001F5EEDF0|nr:uncharacterized protein LOC124737689 [Schistocerca piceifrons]